MTIYRMATEVDLDELAQMRRDMLRCCAQVIKGRIQTGNGLCIIRHSRADRDVHTAPFVSIVSLPQTRAKHGASSTYTVSR